MLIHFSGCFPAAEFCSETAWPTESKILLSGLLQKRFADLCCRLMPFHLPCLPWTKNQAKVLGWKGKEAPLSSFVALTPADPVNPWRIPLNLLESPSPRLVNANNSISLS